MSLIYNKTNWKDDKTTPVNAKNLNNIEDGVEYIYHKWDKIIQDSTTGDHATELIDARYGPNDTEQHPTLGHRLNHMDNKFKEVNSQLEHIEEYQKSIVINVLQPPAGLKPLVCDGITDNNANLQAIINHASDKKDAVIYFPNNGVYYFSKQSVQINNSELNLTIRGENTSILIEEGSVTSESLWILIRNINNMKIEGFNIKSTSTSFSKAIECNNANNLILDYIEFSNLQVGFKINFNYDLDNQFNVNKLITNNINARDIQIFMHICNVKSWQGTNITAHISKDDWNNLPNVAFYLRPGIHNVDLNNIYVEGCAGDVFHFNRIDYEGAGISPPFGTASYVDTNIKINNITVIDFGNLIGINSETKDIMLTNVYCEKQTAVYGGIIQAYEGKCENVVINGFTFKNIKRLVSLTSKDNGASTSHKGIGNINLLNGKLYGELEGDQSCTGYIGCLNLSNIDFYGIDSNNTTGALFIMLKGDINKVILNNLNFNLNNNVQRVSELIRFSDKFNGKAYINNIVVHREISDYKLNVFTVFGSDVNELSKIYLSNVFAYNIGAYGEIYYGDSKYIIKNNCYKDDELNS